MQLSCGLNAEMYNVEACVRCSRTVVRSKVLISSFWLTALFSWWLKGLNEHICNIKWAYGCSILRSVWIPIWTWWCHGVDCCVWDAKYWPLRVVFGILSFPEITPELVLKPATLFRSILNRDTFLHKHSVKMESLVPEICFDLKKDIRTKNLQEN